MLIGVNILYNYNIQGIIMKKPNILIVMTDHQRWDTIEPGNPCITPFTQKFASEGLTFSRTYSPMAHCCPARATFFSGLYPSRTGVWNNVGNAYAINRGPYQDIRMWSQDLKENGYDLAYCGKWHVSARENQQPKDYGWRELSPYSGGMQNESGKWESIRNNTANQTLEGRQYLNPDGYNKHRLYYEQENSCQNDMNTLSLALDELPKLAAQNKPWAMFVGWTAPHAPYSIDKEFLDMYNPDDIQLPESYYDTMEDKPDYYKKLRNRVFDKLGEKGTKEAMRHFWAMCTKIDKNFQQLMESLEQTGQADDTLVLFCSDHGDYNGDHGLFHKQVPAFLGAYKVPAVIRWPNGLKNPGRTCDEFISLADFAPTFNELAGVKTERYMTGISLVPFINDQKPSFWRNEICTQCEGTENLFTQRMVVTKTHKYVYNGFGRDELYDLVNDPHEMKNLDDNSGYDTIKKESGAGQARGSSVYHGQYGAMGTRYCI
jgi:arylsulfatase A-like enzyme